MGKLFCAFSLPFFLRVPVSIVCCCLFPFFLSAQTSERDSLLRVLQNLSNDTSKVHTLNRLSFLYARNSTKKSIVCGIKARDLARKIDFQAGSITANANLGRSYRFSGEYEKAIEHRKIALKEARIIHDSSNIALSLRQIGIIYRVQGDFPKSLQYYFDALKIYESIGDKIRQGSTLSSIGILYYKQKKYQKALRFHKKALEIHKRFKNQDRVAIHFNNIGNVYTDLKKYDEALFYFNSYKGIRERLKDKKGIAIALSNIGMVYIFQKKYLQTIDFCERSLLIRDKLKLRVGKMYPLWYISRAYAGLNQFDKAIFYGKQALEIAEEFGAKFRAIEITESLAEIYQKSGDFKSALFVYQKYKLYSDSVFNETKSEQIAEMETKYGTEKKEQENKYLKLQDVKNKALIRQSTLLNIAAVIGVVLLVVLAVVLYQSNLRKQRTNKVLLFQKQEIETQTEKLRKTNHELEKANVLIRKDRDQKVKIYLQEATEATSKLQQIQDMFTQKGADVAQKLLTNEINTAGELSIIQEKVRNEFPDFAQEIDKALADAKITKVIWQVGYCLKLGKAPVDIAKILPISNRTVSVYGSKL